MPRFSVIVPVFKVQGYLRECLDSVLEQSFVDVEVIAVDDRSPDGCGAILDGYAERDPRVRVLHLPENVGLGRARNAGLEQAGGDYVLFLDSDDHYTPGLLAAVAARLDATGDPDILVFDHVRTHWWGRGGQSKSAGLLAAGAALDTFDVREHPQYLHLFLVAWNKAYRRSFLLAHGLRYEPGLYEDAPVTYRSMVLAGRIACLDRIGVEYRQRRQGAITRTPGRRHFDIFPQYEGLFAFLAQRPDLAWARPLLFERALDHMLFVLACEDRVTPADRPDFHREIRSFHRRHLPADFTPPADARGAEMRLLATAPYASYAVLRGLRTLRGTAGAGGRRVARTVSRATRRTSHAVRSGFPLDPQLALYSASHHRGVTGDPAALYAKARELAPHIHGVWVVRQDAVDSLPPGVDHVTPGSRRYHALTAQATYWVNNVNWPGTPAKRPGSVHIHTHQGTPLKYMAADLLTKPGARHGLDVPRMLRRADRWDYSLVANRHSELVWDRAYPCHFTSLRTGSPRNDALVNAGADDGRAVRARLGVPDGRTVVLYAPTRREYRRGGHVERIDLARFAADLGPDHTLVVRLHPSLATGPARGLGLTELHRRGVLIDATDEPHVEDLMLASDVLLTDYSALMFDYANLDRPIVVHADDWEAYAASRGAYFDITAEAPGHVSRSYRELASLFASGAWRDEEAARLRAAFRDRFCEFDDGRAAERVVRTLMLGEDLLPPGPGSAAALGGLPAPASGRDLLTSS